MTAGFRLECLVCGADLTVESDDWPDNEHADDNVLVEAEEFLAGHAGIGGCEG